MNLPITTPLAFFDLEATGLWPLKDRIIEIAIVRLNPDGTRDEFETRIDPEGIPIAEGAFEKHGIKAEELTSSPKFSEVADKVFNNLFNVFFSVYNKLKL